MMTTALEAALEASAARHGRLCPRQVLGARMGIAAGRELELELPQAGKRLLAIVETDGCVVDAIETATGCSLGHRTMRLEDLGRVAATFIDLATRAAVRIAPRSGVRERAAAYAPLEHRRYYQQLRGYELMPDHELLDIRFVTLQVDLDALIGQKGVRVNCAWCDEEVLNARECIVDGRPVCAACAGDAYYLEDPLSEHRRSRVRTQRVASPRRVAV